MLRAGAEAHHAAIVNANGGLISQEDFATVNAAIGRMIASTPSSKVMDVYNSFAGIVKPEVPSKLMSGVSASDASKAYSALLEFKDVVKTAQASYSDLSTSFSFSR